MSQIFGARFLDLGFQDDLHQYQILPILKLKAFIDETYVCAQAAPGHILYLNQCGAASAFDLRPES
jgi:hypothetical protein